MELLGQTHILFQDSLPEFSSFSLPVSSHRFAACSWLSVKVCYNYPTDGGPASLPLFLSSPPSSHAWQHAFSGSQGWRHREPVTTLWRFYSDIFCHHPPHEAEARQFPRYCEQNQQPIPLYILYAPCSLTSGNALIVTNVVGKDVVAIINMLIYLSILRLYLYVNMK